MLFCNNLQWLVEKQLVDQNYEKMLFCNNLQWLVEKQLVDQNLELGQNFGKKLR